MNQLLRDARFGIRLLWKNPGFTAVAVLTLSLGIAANTAIFSVVYATFIAPLPYHDPEQLVMVWSRIQGNRNVTAAGDFLEWKRQATVFQDINAWTGARANFGGGDRPEAVPASRGTPGFLTMIGYSFALGRDFTQHEGTAGKDHVVILTNRFWQERFGGDPGIIGREVRVNGAPHTVVGVMAAGAGDRINNKVYMPLVFSEAQKNHDFHWLLVMGRLKPGVTLEQANANMSAVADNIARMFPRSNKGWGATVHPLQNNFLSDNTKTALWLMLGAVGFVLLIACANVANLLLARGTARRREVAIRTALGASRMEIIRQLVTESLVLAVLGGVVGVALAAGLMQGILALMPEFTLPSEADVRLNLPVLLVTFGACVLSGVLFGCAPAWQAARANTNETLKESGRSMGDARHRLRRALVVLEFALALTLLAGGGLAIRSLISLSNTSLGFRTDRLLTFNLPMAPDKFPNTDAAATFYHQLLERVEALPGVESVSVSTGMPIAGTSFGMPFRIVGKPVDDPSKRPGAGFNQVSPSYYKTFGIPMQRGRAFTDADRAGAVRVCIVNDVFVKRYMKDVDPLTQRILVEELIPGVEKLGPEQEWQIIGVYAEVRNGGPQGDGFPEIDVPMWQNTWNFASMAIRTSSTDPNSITQSVAAVIKSIDPDLPMARVRTMDQMVNESMQNDRFNTVLFGGFSAMALLLAAFGIYGVMSFVVAQRTHEIGLRMALGAGRGRVLGQILREGMITALIGTAIGAIGAYFVGKAMQGMVYRVGVIDPLAFGIVAMTLLAAALLACLVPASRAASVDPMIALRQE
jgi:putative ABC transport system permease protein